MVSAIKVFYTPRMVADSHCMSPSAAKPAPVVESWQRLGVPLEIVAPQPVTPKQIALAHDTAFVRKILAGEEYNGFGTKTEEVAHSLTYTTGSMLAAAREAMVSGVAAAPCAGFHHAKYSEARAFCTFNGLMVTAQVLLTEGAASKVGILDCDMHYGDGTDNIRERLNLTERVPHLSVGKKYYRASHVEAFLAELKGMVFTFYGCDVLLYQAGADPHLDDPLGGWLNTAQLRQRDQIVFQAAREFGIPIAWNLAGGYQQPLGLLLKIHDNTMRECADVYIDKEANT